MTSKVNGDIQVPVFKYANEALQVNFRKDRNVIGASDLHYGTKKLVINKIYGIEQPPNMRELFGTIIHNLIEYKPVRTNIVRYINDHFTLGDTMYPQSNTEKEYLLEIFPGQYLRMHPDIETQPYIIEIKTTQMRVKVWTREVADAHILQLNDYVCHLKKKFGVLLMINQNAFLSASSDWNYIMKNYSFCLRFEPDYQEFKKSLELSKFLFECINEEDIENKNLKCPIYPWECKRKYCDLKTIKICGKEIYKCPECKRKECVEYPSSLTGSFTDTPFCEQCFKKLYPRLKYAKFKYVNYKAIKK